MGAIIITGVPGVGKSTVIEAAAKARNLKVVVYGTVMFDIASEKGLVKHRDEVRGLRPDVQREIQESAAKRIAAMGDVIVDTHMAIQTPRGLLPGLPEWVAKGLKASQLILVEATPKEIRGRRQKDATRSRDPDTEAAIAEHQETNRRLAAAFATLTGATVAVVENHDGKVEEAKKAVLAVLGT